MSLKNHDDSPRGGCLPRGTTNAHQVHDAQGVADRDVSVALPGSGHDGRMVTGLAAQPGGLVARGTVGCQACGSGHTGHVLAHCSDMCEVRVSGRRHLGYVPRHLGIGGGDDVQFTYCLDCGRIQGAFPLPPTPLEDGRAADEQG